MDIDYKDTGSPIKGLINGFGIILFAVSLFLLCGCEEGPLWDEIERAWGKHDSTSSTSTSDAAANPPSADSTADGGQSASAAAPGLLVYKYGGFHGENAVEDPNTQIGSVRMTANGMTYKWVKGGCENFGAKSREDAGAALACFFYWDEASKSWIGGKADWLSTSRTSRDWKNIRGRYNGWDPDKFFAAKRRAFCVVAVNGKKRTNLAEDGK